MLGELETITSTRDTLNYKMLPVNRLQLNDENVEYINKLLDLLDYNEFSQIVRTKSGGISIDRFKFKDNSYDIKTYGSCIEITILSFRQLRIQLGYKKDDDKTITGWKAFKRFRDTLSKWNINIDDYAIDNGKEVNEEIVKPKIRCTMISNGINDILFANKDTSPIFDNVHHLDFHKAYMSQLYEDYEEFREPITWLYNKRHEDKTIKSVFTNSIGYMHSKLCNYKYAQLSKDAINNFNKKLEDVAYNLVKSGRTILAYNTDGIWYKGEIYHDKYEGDGLTQWSNDYVNCKIRFKSHGAYEFIGTNTETNEVKYKPVIRGQTILDLIKDRSTWQWGDIFDINAFVVRYKVCDNRIIIDKEGIKYGN